MQSNSGYKPIAFILKYIEIKNCETDMGRQIKYSYYLLLLIQILKTETHKSRYSPEQSEEKEKIRKECSE